MTTDSRPPASVLTLNADGLNSIIYILMHIANSGFDFNNIDAFWSDNGRYFL